MPNATFLQYIPTFIPTFSYRASHDYIFATLIVTNPKVFISNQSFYYSIHTFDNQSKEKAPCITQSALIIHQVVHFPKV